jgi:hypothetical protein
MSKGINLLIIPGRRIERGGCGQLHFTASGQLVTGFASDHAKSRIFSLVFSLSENGQATVQLAQGVDAGRDCAVKNAKSPLRKRGSSFKLGDHGAYIRASSHGDAMQVTFNPGRAREDVITTSERSRWWESASAARA